MENPVSQYMLLCIYSIAFFAGSRWLLLCKWLLRELMSAASCQPGGALPQASPPVKKLHKSHLANNVDVALFVGEYRDTLYSKAFNPLGSLVRYSVA